MCVCACALALALALGQGEIAARRKSLVVGGQLWRQRPAGKAGAAASAPAALDSATLEVAEKALVRMRLDELVRGGLLEREQHRATLGVCELAEGEAHHRTRLRAIEEGWQRRTLTLRAVGDDGSGSSGGGGGSSGGSSGGSGGGGSGGSGSGGGGGGGGASSGSSGSVRGTARDASEWVLVEVAALEATLEADQLTLQGMLLQRHVGGVRGDIVACEARLKLLGEVLEEWQSCQALWRSLATLLHQPVRRGPNGLHPSAMRPQPSRPTQSGSGSGSGSLPSAFSAAADTRPKQRPLVRRPTALWRGSCRRRWRGSALQTSSCAA